MPNERGWLIWDNEYITWINKVKSWGTTQQNDVGLKWIKLGVIYPNQ